MQAHQHRGSGRRSICHLETCKCQAVSVRSGLEVQSKQPLPDTDKRSKALQNLILLQAKKTSLRKPLQISSAVPQQLPPSCLAAEP